MSKYRISMNGKVYEMEIELVEDKPTVPHPTHNVTNVVYKNEGTANSVVQVIDPAAKSTTTRNENRIESLMPGTVIKISANPGDIVERGQPILTLEAMKMENEITAPKSGIIKEIFAKEGQTVPHKFVLFEME